VPGTRAIDEGSHEEAGGNERNTSRAGVHHSEEEGADCTDCTDWTTGQYAAGATDCTDWCASTEFAGGATDEEGSSAELAGGSADVGDTTAGGSADEGNARATRPPGVGLVFFSMSSKNLRITSFL